MNYILKFNKMKFFVVIYFLYERYQNFDLMLHFLVNSK